MEFDSDMSLRVLNTNEQKPRLGSCLMTLHCHRCSAVLGDSLAVCGEFKRTESIMILRVTDSVSLSDQTGSTMDHGLKNCYIIEQSKMVKALDVVFDLKPISEDLNEAIKGFRAQCDDMCRLHDSLLSIGLYKPAV